MLACSRAGDFFLIEAEQGGLEQQQVNPLEDQPPGQLQDESNSLQSDPVSVIVDYVPTPDPFRGTPQIRTGESSHVVAYGESLQSIALAYGVGAARIQQVNGISNPDVLYQGQVLLIPPQDPLPPGEMYKIIPDSVLVHSPASMGSDLMGLVDQQQGFLSMYSEEVDDRIRTGAEIVERVSWQYSINPLLLLALLEYQSGWVFASEGIDTGPYPMGWARAGYEGLYSQLSWTADQLNSGYYRWRAGWNGPLLFASGDSAYFAQGLNAGTAALQYYFAQLYEPDAWQEVISRTGFFRTYYSMFGSPFTGGLDPLIPADLTQPELVLPFEPGRGWYFTGGPHSAWGNYAAWAALDFAPPGEGLGCIPSYDWVTAAADGRILRSDTGAVLQDLDGDGDERTGWVVLYMHIASYDRVQVGAEVLAGERIGHPSCEGGISTGTHVHIARRYNGEWISADAGLPFNLSGWISSGAGSPYDGWLTRDGRSIEAYWTDSPENVISR